MGTLVSTDKNSKNNNVEQQLCPIYEQHKQKETSQETFKPKLHLYLLAGAQYRYFEIQSNNKIYEKKPSKKSKRKKSHKVSVLTIVEPLT